MDHDDIPHVDLSMHMPTMDHHLYVKKAGYRSNIQTPEDDGASRHVASSYTYKNGTRSKLPSRDAVFLIGSLTRPSWTRMRALLPQPRTKAGRSAAGDTRSFYLGEKEK